MQQIRNWFGKNKVYILALFILGIVVYCNTFGNQLFWDDEDFAVRNQYVQNFEFEKFFSENVIAGAGFVSNYWRPALLTVFSLEYQIWGSWAPGYHIVNFLFHLFSAFALFFLIQKFTRRQWVSFFVSAIFLIHPLQTEAVSYVSSLGDSLSVFLIIFGLIFYQLWIEKKSIKFYAFAIGLYVLALMSKETAIIMPGLISLVDFFHPEQRSQPFLNRVTKTLKRTAAFYLIGFVYIACRATFLNFQNTFNLYGEETDFTNNIFVRLLTFFRIYGVYLSLLILPVGLHMERSVDIAYSFSQTDVVLGGIALLLTLLLIIYSFRKYWWVSFGLLWFLFALVPTSNVLVPINGLIYEHWLYLPLVGFFFAIIYSLEEFFKKVGKWKIFVGIFLLLLIPFSVQGIRRNSEWKTAESLYKQTLQHAPNSYRVINNLGKYYAEGGDFAQAEFYYQRAILTEPDSPVAYHNLANIYRDFEKIDEAIEYYKLALAKDPGFVFSANSLLSLYLETGKYGESREFLEKELDKAPSSQTKINLLLLLAQIAESQGDYQSAEEYYREAVLFDQGNSDLQSQYIQFRQRNSLRK